MRRGPGSRPFDGEGLASRTNVLVSEGLLRTFLCDVYAARKLGRRSTGSAARGIGGSPHVGVSNLIMRPGRTRAADLEKIDRGLYVTDLMGFGFNAVTGDYSQGAGGFWIERGERAFPVTRDHRLRQLRRALEGDRRDRRRSRHAHVGAVPDVPRIEHDDRRQLSRRGPATTSPRWAPAR